MITSTSSPLYHPRRPRCHPRRNKIWPFQMRVVFQQQFQLLSVGLPGRLLHQPVGSTPSTPMFLNSIFSFAFEDNIGFAGVLLSLLLKLVVTRERTNISAGFLREIMILVIKAAATEEEMYITICAGSRRREISPRRHMQSSQMGKCPPCGKGLVCFYRDHFVNFLAGIVHRGLYPAKGIFSTILLRIGSLYCPDEFDLGVGLSFFARRSLLTSWAGRGSKSSDGAC